jgi:hypothetical protein
MTQNHPVLYREIETPNDFFFSHFIMAGSIKARQSLILFCSLKS